MCIGYANPGLFNLLKKCSLLFGYLNCTAWRNKNGTFIFESGFEPEDLDRKLEALRIIIPHGQKKSRRINKPAP